eukprot:c14444_g1_i1 orf=1-327(-)
MSSEEAEQSTDSSQLEEQEQKDGQKGTAENDDAVAAESILAALQAQQTKEPEEEPVGDGAAEAADQAVSKDENSDLHRITIDDIKTAPMDFRFPTCNQAKHCFTRYIEY